MLPFVTVLFTKPGQMLQTILTCTFRALGVTTGSVSPRQNKIARMPSALHLNSIGSADNFDRQPLNSRLTGNRGRRLEFVCDGHDGVDQTGLGDGGNLLGAGEHSSYPGINLGTDTGENHSELVCA